MNATAPASLDIVRDPDECYGAARFAGTGLTIWRIMADIKFGMADAEQMDALPEVTQAHLDVARAYYRAHKDEVDSDIAAHIGNIDEIAIVKTPGTCGGSARFDGTRIAVWNLVSDWRNGRNDRYLIENFPLTLTHLAAARSYYDLHKDEVDADIRENEDA